MISDRGIWANLFHWDASLTTGAPLAPLAVDAVLCGNSESNDDFIGAVKSVDDLDTRG